MTGRKLRTTCIETVVKDTLVIVWCSRIFSCYYMTYAIALKSWLHFYMNTNCRHIYKPSSLLLDLLSAFGTIDLPLFLDWLQELRVGNTVLCWFSSFLRGQSQLVLIRNESSWLQPLCCGMPQDLVISLPLTSTWSPLVEIILRHRVRYLQQTSPSWAN